MEGWRGSREKRCEGLPNGRPPLIGINLPYGANRAPSSGVVNQDVDRSEFFGYLLYGSVDLCLVRNVGCSRERFAAAIVDEAGDLFDLVG